MANNTGAGATGAGAAGAGAANNNVDSIYHYIIKKNINGVKKYINSGGNVNELFDNETPLDTAIIFGLENEPDNDYFDIIELLLAAGAKTRLLELTNDKGSTILLISVRYGRTKTVGLLIAAGADVNKENNVNTLTPLLIAIVDQYAEIVELLIAAGVDVNKTDAVGRSPIYVAIHGNIKIIKLLIDSGADVNKATDNGNIPLLYVLVKGDVEKVKLLIAAGADVNKTTNTGLSPLVFVAVRGSKETGVEKNKYIEIIKLLINAGARLYELNAPRKNDFSPEINALITSMEPKWKGFTRSDIERLDTIFDTDIPNDGSPPSAENWSMCPICLSFVFRSDGCKYMRHMCPNIHPDNIFNRKLYNQYKNAEGEIAWCTICNRICSGHRHYKIQPYTTTNPLLEPIIPMPANTFFSSDCRGPEGGGGLPEKLLRFRRFKEYARELQGDINMISKDLAIKTLVEEMWNAPFMRVHEHRLAKIRTNRTFNTSTNNFSPNVAPIVNKEIVYFNAIKPLENIDLIPVIKKAENGAENMVGYASSGNVIFFKHRQPDGSIYNHETKETGIGIESLINTVKDKTKQFAHEQFLFCYMHPECQGIFWPDDIKGIVPDDLYMAYKEKFNRKFGERFGGIAGAGGRNGENGVEERKNMNGGRGRGGRTRGRGIRGGGGIRGGSKDILLPAIDAVCIIARNKIGGKSRKRKNKKSL